MKRRDILAATAAVGSIGVAGCLGDEEEIEPVPDPEDIVETISIERRDFEPATIDIDVGDAVEWVNNRDTRSEIVHTSGVGEDWELSEEILAGESFALAFNMPGVFAYHDRHVTEFEMCGAVAVGDDGLDDIPPLPCE